MAGRHAVQTAGASQARRPGDFPLPAARQRVEFAA
eukprot:CAMPEP_0175332836 /NCGR_PEP_ID=MMETSP0095-20121207/1971_1 /TAXON_ID=311494 /ORGANISM="Alexandrium monilatum, Strain CCMP3105" /LENGTH=34 /DNA_ID= /DNA_START= /DNA_END= /DNA_ORIENTATION=